MTQKRVMMSIVKGLTGRGSVRREVVEGEVSVCLFLAHQKHRDSGNLLPGWSDSSCLY